MRILQINKYHYIKGGADSVFFNTIQLLQLHGDEVVPFCIHHPQNIPSEYEEYFVDAPEIREMKGLVAKMKSISRFIVNKDATQKLEDLLSHEQIDVAHVHNVFNGISLAILPVLKKHNIPVVVTMHDTRFICPSSYFNLRGKWCETCRKSFFLNCAIKKCYQDNLPNSIMCAMEMFHKEFIFYYDKYISQYIFVSNKYRRFHTQRHNYFKKKGVLLYNFLPALNDVKPNSNKGNYLLYYGRITLEKGIAMLVEVMKKFPDITLKVAGRGVLLDQLSKIAPPNVEFEGFVSGKQLEKLVGNASFVIVPSEWEENNPLTIIESYSLGKPVIGARIGGIPEIIEEGENGFVFEAFNRDSLVETIKKALAVDKTQYLQMSKNARSFAESHFAPEQHYEQLLNIYKQAIDDNENN